MPVTFDAKSASGYGAIPKGPNEPAPKEGSFEEFLRGLGLKGESDPYRLDLAKFILVTLYIAGNFIRPFAQADSKLACALHNFVSIFTLPAFTMITGYLSMEMTRPRKRFLIAYLIIPYLVLQSLYLIIEINLYWRHSFRNNSVAPAGGEFSRNNGQFSYNFTPQPNWGPLSYFTPVGDTWYLISLATWSMWRPYAVELKNTVFLHIIIGCLMGYTTIDRFMTLHRTVVLLPYFLAGHMLRRYKIFVPYAKTWPQFACAVFVMAFALAGCVTATYAFDHKSSQMFTNEQEYFVVWKEDYRWGGVIQLFVYIVSSLLTAAFFALLPPAANTNMIDLENPEEGHSGSTMRKSSDDRTFKVGKYSIDYSVGDPDDVETEFGAAGDPLLVRSRRKWEAAERDQVLLESEGGGNNWHAIVYLRCAKWGTRCLCPLMFNFLVMIILEICMYYDSTWYAQNTETAAWEPNGLFTTLQVVFTFLLGATIALLLSLRPTTMVLGWLLAPPLTSDWFFEQGDDEMKLSEKTFRKLNVGDLGEE
tara:strand:- start:2240 stop:3838 length:1599 start_codon:yes stop_codon:yes gene_type:complete